MGGTIFPLKNREYVFDHTSKDNTKYFHPPALALTFPSSATTYTTFSSSSTSGWRRAGRQPGYHHCRAASPLRHEQRRSERCLCRPGWKVARALDLDADGKIDLLYQQAYNRPATPAETNGAGCCWSGSSQPTCHGQPPIAGETGVDLALPTRLSSANEFLFLR